METTSTSPAPDQCVARHCGHCGAAATQACAGCHNIKYCNRGCQRNDWALHKHLCKTFADFKTPPNPNTRRVIVLPQETEKPHFAWIETYKTTARDLPWETPAGMDPSFNVPKYEEKQDAELCRYGSLIGESADPVFNVVLGSINGGEHLDHSINMLCRANGDTRNDVNKCIDKLSFGQGESMSWLGRGQRAIFCMSKVVSSMQMRDADCGDLTLGIKGWVEFAKQDVANRAMMRRTCPWFIDSIHTRETLAAQSSGRK